MKRDICKVWSDLNQNIVVNKRELILGITTCALAGILLGILISPNKTMTIGSNNGNNNSAALPQEPCEEKTAEETEE